MNLVRRIESVTRFALVATVLLMLGACRPASRPDGVVLLALDGVDPDNIDLLLAEGKLPNFARLRRDGAYGRLESAPPLLSPVVWTTIATGKRPEQHGIGHFVAFDTQSGESLPVTSEMRRVKAVWNILSEHEKRVGVVGWWATWPAERVNGTIVSDHTSYHFLFPQGLRGDGRTEGLTHPPELAARLAPYLRRPADITFEQAADFIKVSPEEFSRPFDFDDEVSHFKWALAAAETHRRVGLRLLEEENPELLMVYVEGTDSLSHLFGHLFRAGPLAGELSRQQQKYGDAVERMYHYADRLIGDYLEAMGPEATLVVLSDHGFELGALPDDPSRTRDMRRVSERYHRMQGILYLYGDRIKKAGLAEPSILDVAPTLLALNGLPPARDMPGRVLTEALEFPTPAPAVASYESTASPAPSEAAPPSRDASADPEILERLRSLGYLGGGSSGSSATPEASSSPGEGEIEEAFRSPGGERMLAALHFEAGRYQEAAEAYARLLEDRPRDAALHTSFAGVLGALERYDEALAHLQIAIELDPLNVEAYHNTAVILEKDQRVPEAIEHYRTAIRYRPGYQPSRRALVRLTGAADERAPTTEAERRAYALAESAQETARRGDYPEAMRRLAEAERIAPGYVVIYQYESNVAYLMGDIAEAKRALEKAIALEPENALFRRNLESLERLDSLPSPAKK